MHKKQKKWHIISRNLGGNSFDAHIIMRVCVGVSVSVNVLGN